LNEEVKNMHRSTLILASLLLVPTLAAPAVGGNAPPGAPPPARAIPALTAPDMFPRGCVDCHVNQPDHGIDARFSVLMKGWQAGAHPKLAAAAQSAAPAGLALAGRHPEAVDALTDIPRACMACHADPAAQAPDFARLVHRVHLAGGQENHFLTLFQGECTHCHKPDLATGAWAVPSAAE